MIFPNNCCTDIHLAFKVRIKTFLTSVLVTSIKRAL